MKRYLLLILILLQVNLAIGQAPRLEAPPVEIDLDNFIQRLAATQQEDINYEDLYEALLQFYLNPINLNAAKPDELRSLFLLSESQIQNFFEHKNRFGNLLSLYELQTIEGFDAETIQTLRPFIRLSNGVSVNDVKGIFNRATDHFLVIRTEQTLEKADGYKEGKYLGSPQKLYARYRLQHPKDFSLGFIMEKDQGEPNIADYTTFHFQLQNKGKLKNAIIGDYQLQFGQGLVMSGGYAAGKGGEPIYTTRRSDLGIRPHNSVLEGGFLRGAAATYQTGQISLTAFGSYTKRDASINTDVEEREDVFSSILSSGLHRTQSEIDKKGLVNETSTGINAKWQHGDGHIGFTVLNTNYSNPLERNSREYAVHEFKGTQNTVMGPNFSYSWQNFNFFGEAARSSSGGIGAIGGFVASLSPQVEWALNFRNYDKDFHSFYSNAFGEGSRTINEKGIYTGFKYTPKRGYTFAAFYDKFKFPWLRYLVDGPSDGDDYLLRFTLKPTKKWIFYTQYHREQKQKNFPGNESVSDYLVKTTRQNLLAQFEFNIFKNFKSQTRVQYNSFQYETLDRSNGYALIQDIEGSIGRLQLKSRIALFSTDSFDSRIYAYENDVLYTVSFPAYFGKGTRLYLVSRYSLTRKIDVWARIARTSLTDRDTISSGNNEIDVPHRTDVKLQVRYRF
ncbi:helix-hairpin-helix domain-containing protein [uncultured Arcticibacterium sp.]|uniref:ComEA family DNA-binding protein n=1 Tax=uncultured Arcticibacterium sp. TaxID=2173042 RepID=UPI0030FC6210